MPDNNTSHQPASLIIIGSGPGGYRTAAYAAQHGMDVTIFEQAEVGGTCLNCGCIPTKALCHDAEQAAPSFTAALQRKQQVVEQLRSGIEILMAQPHIQLIRAQASFKSANTVIADGKEYTANAIVIATGSAPKMPPIPGIDSPAVVTSTELLEIDPTALPKRLCIIGAGVIGLELASIFNAFGTQVTVLEFLKECLPAMDSDIAKRLRKQLEHSGIEFFMQASVQAIEGGHDGEASRVRFEYKGKTEAIETDLILVATGRRPNTEGLNLAATGIMPDERGFIPVNSDTFEVTVGSGSPAASPSTRLFAIGDVNGHQLLAHAATYQGLRVVNHLLGRPDGIRFDIMPAAVFTQPEVAAVGPTEQQLKAQGIDYQCHKAFYRANGRALAMNQTEGIVKILTDTASNRILACHILGAHAADMVQEVTAFMNLNATLAQLRETIHIHPTLSEILAE